MANIRQRGDCWAVQIRKKGFPPVNRTFDKKADAEKWVRETESEMDAHVWQDTRGARETPFTDLLDRYILEVCPTKRSGDNQAYKLRSFKEQKRFQKPVSAITAKDIADFKRERIKANYAAATIRLELSLLSKVFKVARQDWGYTSLQNPAAVSEVSRPELQPHEKRDRVATDEETNLILSNTDSSFLAPFVRLLNETAARRGELCKLRWENVNLVADPPTATLYLTKNGKNRTIPLSPKAVELLNGRSGTRIGPVFKSPSWEPDDKPELAPALRADSVTQAWIRARTRTAEKTPAVQDLRLHDHRHTATTRLFEHEANLREMDVALITGHEDLRSLKRYTHQKAKTVGTKLGWAQNKQTEDDVVSPAAAQTVRKDGDEIVVVIDGIEGRGKTVNEALALVRELRALLDRDDSHPRRQPLNHS